jgi:hypothetical protein
MARKLKNKSLLLQGFLAAWDYLDVKLAEKSARLLSERRMSVLFDCYRSSIT